MPKLLNLTSGQLLEIILAAIEVIRVPTVRIAIRVLPDGLERPTARDGTRRATVPRQHERAVGGEGFAIARAGRPPFQKRSAFILPTSAHWKGQGDSQSLVLYISAYRPVRLWYVLIKSEIQDTMAEVLRP